MTNVWSTNEKLAMRYLLFAIGAMVMWGLWGFLPRLATARLDFKSATFWEWIGMFAVAITCLALVGGKPQTGGGAFLWAVATGFCGLLGALLYYKAMSLSNGNTAAVATLSALYPVVAILLAVIVLRETLSPGQIIGIALCLAGGIVLSLSSSRIQVPATTEPVTAHVSQG